MPITLNYQPSAQGVGTAAYTAGAENLRRYEQAQAVQQQELAQRERMQQASFADAQYRQGQQLDYNSRAAALGVYANQATQERSFDQQSRIQDQSLQSATSLQDQRLQYGYQQQQNSIADAQFRQEQSLGSAFARQYLGGQQQAASNQQNFQNEQAANQQKLDFSLYAMDQQQQAEVNKIQQSRARVEQMRANGQLNDIQYQQADAQIKSRELGLSQALTPQKNTTLLDQLNSSLVQHQGTGQWFQQNPQTGTFDPVKEPQQQQDQVKLKALESQQKLKLDMAKDATKLYLEMYKLRTDTNSPLPDMARILQDVQQAYGQSSAGPIPGMRTSQFQPSGPPAPQQKKAFIVQGANGFPENPNQAKFTDAPVVGSDAEVDKLPPGTYFKARGNDRQIFKTAGSPQPTRNKMSQYNQDQQIWDGVPKPVQSETYPSMFNQ